MLYLQYCIEIVVGGYGGIVVSSWCIGRCGDGWGCGISWGFGVFVGGQCYYGVGKYGQGNSSNMMYWGYQ